MADSFPLTIQWLCCRISKHSNSGASLGSQRSLTTVETTYALMGIELLV
jgi:hypothetical protein